MSSGQQVAFDPVSETYEIFDDYAGMCLDKAEIRRLFRAVKKHTPEWLGAKP